MAEVHAIKEAETIKLISHLLETRYSKQMSLIWNIGLNLALRISDLLSIKYTDIQGDRLFVHESKTDKRASIKLNDKAQLLINHEKLTHPEHIYLFQSYRNQQALNKAPRPLTRRAVTRAFAEVGKELGIALGTHSMRKTRGYLMYQSSKDIAKVMSMLRHSSVGVSLRYIGITQEDIDNDFAALEI